MTFRLFLLPVVFLLVTPAAHAQDTTRISLLFAGDVMGHDSQIASAYDPVQKKHDYIPCFQHIAPYVQQADLAIANLEVTLAGRPYKGYPQFSSPDALAVALKQIGFDALVTANNHCVDRGRKGLERTVRVLDSLRIPHTGTFIDTAAWKNENPLMLYKNGFTIALLNYTYGTNGLPVYRPNVVNLIDSARISADLEKACKASPDLTIVFMHWGGEYQSLPSKAQKQLTDHCFSKGAQLVIGAHPHVIQPMELRNEKQFVAYSLGNWVSGQRKQYTDGGSMAWLELEKIRFSPDSSVSRIDSVGYLLQWVYRTADAKRDYYVLAAPDHQKNLDLIADKASEDAYNLFLKDSRALSAKYNQKVSEITAVPHENSFFTLLLMRTNASENPWPIITSQREYIWGIDRHDQEDGTILFTSGKFSTREKAEQYRQRYLAQHPEAIVIQLKISNFKFQIEH